MLFTSYEFLGFIAVLFCAYYLVPRRCQWGLLLAASCLFYFIAGPEYLIYLAVTAATTWQAALQIEKNARRQTSYLKARKDVLSKEEKKAYKAEQKRVRAHWAAACLLLNTGILAVVKYTNFFISNVNGILDALGQTKLSFVTLALPMGISFYTFQAAGYLIDVYRGKYPAERNFFRFALFVSFFPQLVQGPISRFDELAAAHSLGILQEDGDRGQDPDRRLRHNRPHRYLQRSVCVCGDDLLYPGAVRGLHWRHRYHHRHRGNHGHHCAGKLPPPILLQVLEGVLAQVAYFHVLLVPGLPFLPCVHVQMDAEIFQIYPRTAGGEDWPQAAGISLVVHRLVCHRDMARGKLEFYRLGTSELGGFDDLRGAGAALPAIS